MKELDEIYNRFTEVAVDYSVNYQQFEELFKQDYPNWTWGLDELFKLLDKKRTGTIDVSDYITTLSIIKKGSSDERLFCMS